MASTDQRAAVRVQPVVGAGLKAVAYSGKILPTPELGDINCNLGSKKD